MSEPRRFCPPSELDELRKEVVLLRCRVDDNSDEIKKLQETQNEQGGDR